MVYFIIDVLANAVKVGFTASDSPDGRLREFQVGNPNPLFLLGAIPGEEVLEDQIKSELKTWKVHGEWFEACPKVLWYILRKLGTSKRFNRALVPERPPRRDARKVLIEMFNQQREWESGRFWGHLQASGIGRRAFDQARLELAVPRTRQVVVSDGLATHVWWVPADWPYLKDDSSIDNSLLFRVSTKTESDDGTH